MLPEINQKSTRNRPEMERKSTGNRPEIDPKSIRNRPEIDQKSTGNRPEIERDSGAYARNCLSEGPVSYSMVSYLAGGVYFFVLFSDPDALKTRASTQRIRL